MSLIEFIGKEILAFHRGEAGATREHLEAVAREIEYLSYQQKRIRAMQYPALRDTWEDVNGNQWVVVLRNEDHRDPTSLNYNPGLGVRMEHYKQARTRLGYVNGRTLTRDVEYSGFPTKPEDRPELEGFELVRRGGELLWYGVEELARRRHGSRLEWEKTKRKDTNEVY